jgi:hypothetical protein
MSGQSQDPINTDYRLGTGTGGLGTDWAWARDWAQAGWAWVDCVQTSRVPTNRKRFH